MTIQGIPKVCRIHPLWGRSVCLQPHSKSSLLYFILFGFQSGKWWSDTHLHPESFSVHRTENSRSSLQTFTAPFCSLTLCGHSGVKNLSQGKLKTEYSSCFSLLPPFPPLYSVPTVYTLSPSVYHCKHNEKTQNNASTHHHHHPSPIIHHSPHTLTLTLARW